MKIRIEVDNKTVLDALNRLQQSGARPSPVLLEIGEELLESTKARFGAQTAPDGSHWAPNAVVTLLRKKGNRPLIGETGTLMDQINYQLLNESTLELGSPTVYAATQQFGASKGQFGRTRRNAPIPWGDIPARPFIGISESDSDTILDLVTKYLQESI